jgi:hypothetical protein
MRFRLHQWARQSTPPPDVYDQGLIECYRIHIALIYVKTTAHPIIGNRDWYDTEYAQFDWLVLICVDNCLPVPNRLLWVTPAVTQLRAEICANIETSVVFPRLRQTTSL